MKDKWHHHDEGLHEEVWDFHERIREMESFGGLRSWILYALKDGPKNGVEIMDSIQELSRFARPFRRHGHGHRHERRFSDRRAEDMDEFSAWRPSPGSIYPMLGKMTNEDLIMKREDGRYEMTQVGRDAFSRIFGQSESCCASSKSGPYSVENVLSEMSCYASYLEDISKETLAPHEAVVDEIIRKLAKVKESLSHN